MKIHCRNAESAAIAEKSDADCLCKYKNGAVAIAIFLLATGPLFLSKIIPVRQYLFS